MPVLYPHCTVLIDGVEYQSPEWSTESELDRPSSASIVLTGNYNIAYGADVQIFAAPDVGDAERRVFWGLVTKAEKELDDTGIVVDVSASGWAWVLDLALEESIRFAGGEETDPVLLLSGVKHVGNTTYAWYANNAADGLTVDLSFAPQSDSRFVRITGRHHGSNSYDEEPDKDITEYSRIELYQAGNKIGYVNLPSMSERHDDELDYSSDANWDDFDVMAGCNIHENAGAVTVRFVSGTKPGDTTRDDYEVKGVYYQTAGQNGLRQLFASVMKDRGFGASANGVPYRIKTIKDRDGHEILVGGNGLINNGLVQLEQEERPFSWMCEVGNLFGYHGICGPNSVDIQAVRGSPSNLSVDVSWREGIELLSIKPADTMEQVVTDWTVVGASGSDENGDPFQYQSITEGATPPSFLPDPPGVIASTLSHDILTSDKLCQQVREIQEVETTVAPTIATLTVKPTAAVRPGMVARVVSASVGISRRMWITRVAQSWGDDGWWTTADVRASNGAATPEEDPAVSPETPPDTAVKHIGSGSIAWYGRPAPNGTTVTLDWYVGSTSYRAVRVYGLIHGANSYPSGSPIDTYSTLQIWQFTTMIAEINLPKSPERYLSRLDYTNDSNWSSFDVVLAVDIDGADAQLKFTRGQAEDNSYDHYEVKDVVVELYSEANERGTVPTSGADWHAYQARRRYRWATG